ncbi:phospholipase D family protein [Pseudoclavibacter helvolus]|uniref:phospholipase D family protein n=1 Tax=Pseudoclavibacter helvolus TaxID=255205 RepID=UPI000837E0F8|nr:phospholipase D family protein [Pseudoclavibacter helvolus]
MLEPQTRAALTEQLAPPPGYELVHAVGTTFTLDLATALTVPLCFASHRVSAADDQLGILNAIHRAADRIDVFAQAGEISMGTTSKLVAFLEPMLHPVTVRRGIFHPKVWYLEYAAGEHRSYRFLCASRNLTDDRSWDTLVRLDGTPAPAGRKLDARRKNKPLVTLLKRLPKLAVHPVAAERVERIDALADRWGTVEWELPTGVRDLAFHAFGVGASARPEMPGRRALVVSPFVTDDGFAALRGKLWGETHLVSRAETIDRLAPATLSSSKLQTHVLDGAANDTADIETGHDDGADDDTADNNAGAPAAVVAATPVRAADRLVGLHAKVVIVDRDHTSRVFLGSANATRPGWETNVEVMVELIGKTSVLGVDATLAALGNLIEPYQSDGGASEPDDEAAEARLEHLLRGLAGLRIHIEIGGDGPYSLRVQLDDGDRASFERRIAKAGATLHWHLLPRPDLRRAASTLANPGGETLDEVALTDISPFVVLTARDADGRERSTIVLAQLAGDVAERRDAIIASQLTDRASFVRLLTLLLELSGVAMPTVAATGATGFFGTAAGSDAAEGAGLFEALLRAVAAGHDGLADAKRIIDYLASHGEDQAMMPPGFDSLWKQVWTAHLELTGATA